MSSISGDFFPTALTSDSGSMAAMQNQIANLQRQCADWQSCATTPAPEKEKMVSTISQQISALQHKIEQAQKVQPASGVIAQHSSDAINSLQPATVVADGTNRPSTDPFATAGSVLNTSI